MSQIKFCFDKEFLQDPILDPKSKLVYIVGKTYVDIRYPNKPATFSIATIAQQTGFSMTSVKTALKDLQEKGYIVRKQRFNEAALTFFLK